MSPIGGAYSRRIDTRPWIASAVALMALTASPAASRAAAFLYAVDGSNDHLLGFYGDAPGTLVEDVPLTGLGATESIAGLDLRPATGELYAIAIDGALSRLVTIDRASGAVTPLGSLLATPLGSSFGLDFNPVADRVRFVGDADVNQRVNPTNGALASTDTSIAYAAGDPGDGANPSLVHVAYTNSFVGATATTLFGIDTSRDALVRVGGVDGLPSPNGGQLTTIGLLSVAATSMGGFDIDPGDGTGYAALRVGSASQLYTIDLATGAATLVGSVGSADVVGIAVPEPASLACALGVWISLGALRRGR